MPATLQASLVARLDRLPATRELAQIGATIGREFSYELLAAVAKKPEADLQDALSQLTSAAVFVRGRPPDAVYSFKHALVRDAAYGTLLRSRRQQLHAQIANVIESKFLKIAEAQPELLAHHCTQAGEVEKAIEYRLKAGELGRRRFALAEAVAQLRMGLELLENLSDGPERKKRELQLQLALARALVASKGLYIIGNGQGLRPGARTKPRGRQGATGIQCTARAFRFSSQPNQSGTIPKHRK